MKNFKICWDYMYGSKSHMNLAGKLLLGIPMAPIVLILVTTYTLLDSLFTKHKT
jgi:hypothetical protein